MALYAKINNRQEIIGFPIFFTQNIDPSITLQTNLIRVSEENKPEYIDWKTEAYPDTVDTSGGKRRAVYKIKQLFDETTDFNTKQTRLKYVYDMYKVTNYEIFKTKLSILTKGYTDEEVSTWPDQVREAKAYQETQQAGPLITAISEKRGITLQELVARILSKSDIYNEKYGKLLGQYRKNEDILAQVDPNIQETWDNINQYTWNIEV